MSKSQSRSSTQYPGGKGGVGVYQTIINQIPPHEVYIEPFAGGAAIFRHKRRAEQTILCEANPVQAEKLRYNYEVRSVAVMQYNGIDLMMDEWARHMGRACWYCDPPYPLETRTKKLVYGQQEWDDDTHRKFLEACWDLSEDDSKPFVLISTYPNEMYEQRLKGWRRIEFEAMTRGGVKRTEWLFMNYAAPTELHDYRYYGRNKRQREVIRRAGRSMARKLKARHARDPLAAKAVMSYLEGAVIE